MSKVKESLRLSIEEKQEITDRVLVNKIIHLASHLPESIPLATKEDKIYEVFTSKRSGNDFQIFNRLFDNVFGADLMDSEANFRYLRRGPLGIGLVVEYLSVIPIQNLTRQLMLIKLDRIYDNFLTLV
jgi:hypothetical protein